MILDTSLQNKKNKEIIDEMVGKPFSFLERIKMKGIGSSRMIVDKSSPSIEKLMNTVSDLNYANLELRPRGILLMLNRGLLNYTWIIPYYQLVFYKTEGSSIHAQGNFIHFRNDEKLRDNQLFFKKMLAEKLKYDSLYPRQTGI